MGRLNTRERQPGDPVDITGPPPAARGHAFQICSKGPGKASTKGRSIQAAQAAAKRKQQAAKTPGSAGPVGQKPGKTAPELEKGAYYQRNRNEKRPLMGVEPSGAQRKKRAFCAPGFFLLFRGKPRAAQEPAPEGRKRGRISHDNAPVDQSPTQKEKAQRGRNSQKIRGRKATGHRDKKELPRPITSGAAKELAIKQRTPGPGRPKSLSLGIGFNMPPGVPGSNGKVKKNAKKSKIFFLAECQRFTRKRRITLIR